MATSGLATVLFTDLVGSTRLRDRLGDDVADEIGGEHDRIIGDALASSGGRLVKNLGDGALAVFDSSVDAVVAAQRIQEGMTLYNRQADDARQIGVRIGINAGEVAKENGDVIGLPVAVASRVCDTADAGQILVTDTVRSLIGRRAHLDFASIGAHSLKGVDDLIELWSVAESQRGVRTENRADVPFPPFLTRGIPAHLIGREEPLAQLDAAHASATESVQFAAVIGEPGLGKTSLTSTWCRSTADNGTVVVAGRCTPDSGLPYQPFIEVARAVLSARPQVLLEAGAAAGNVAQLVPGIEAPKGLPVPIQTDLETTQYLMAEAFAALLKPEEGGSPTVVVLDDLHWADEHTVAALAHLTRKDELGALVIGTYRDTDLVRSHPLPKLLTGLRRDHRIHRIPLRRLSDDEIEEMISAHFGTAAGPDIVESIAEETQGNPFFVEEITNHLQEEGAIDADGRWNSDTSIGDYGIPEGLREVIGRRVDRLGPDAVSALEVASVIGPTFSIDVAGAIAELDEHAVDGVVDAATNAGIVDEGDGADEFVFAHALVRQTLYDGLPIRRRTRVHRAVAEALERRKAPSATLLNHWLQAERPEKALECAVAAANAAEMSFASSDMIAYLELALDLWDDVDDPEVVVGTPHADVVIRLVEAQGAVGGFQEAALARVSIELDRTDLDDRTRALLLNAMSRHLWIQGRQAQSREMGDEALRVVPKDRPNPAHAEILASVAGSRMLNAQSTEAIAQAREALTLAQETGSKRAELNALNTLATATGNLGDVEESNRYFDLLAERADVLGHLRNQLIVFVNQSAVLGENGRVAAALELTERGILRAREVGWDRWEAMLHGNAASLLFEMGRWDEAEQHLRAMPPPVEMDHSQINISLGALELAAEQGDGATTQRELDRLGALTLDELDSQLQGPYWAARVSDLRWHDDVSGAYDLAAEGLQALDRDQAWIHAMQLAALAVESVGDGVESGIATAAWIEAADEWHSRFSVGDISTPLSRGFAATATADLARVHGRNDPDLRRASIEAWSDVPYFEAKAMWRLAQALVEHDPTDPEATKLLDDAAGIAVGLKATPLLDAVAATRQTATR